MKKKNLKRVAATILALAMLLTGCKGPDKQPTGSSGSTGAGETQSDTGWQEVSAKVDIPEIMKKDAEHLSWMDTTSPVTLSVYYPYNVGNFPEWGSTAVQQKMTELTGVTIDASWSKTSDGNEFTLMLASGDPLPDIIKDVWISSNQYRELVEAGDLWDLKELMDMYCPEMWESMDPFIREALLDEDGHMYYLPRGGKSAASADYFVCNGWFAVRGDVCEYFDIDPKSITTLADVENLISLYMQNKELWPEIKYPYYFNALNNGISDGKPFYNCFGGLLNYGEEGNDTLVYDKESDSVHHWMEDEYGYQALEYMWRLAQKGYVNQSSFAVQDIYNEMEAGSILVAGGKNMWRVQFTADALASNVEGAYYERICLPSADEDQKAKFATSLYYASCGSGTVITKDCEDPERAIKFLQFLGSEYGQMLVTAGIYGEDWVEAVDENGKTTIEIIGEAKTAEGQAKRGIYNYNFDWLYTNEGYDDLYALVTNDSIMKEIVQSDVVFDAYAAVPFKVLSQQPTTSECMKVYRAVEEIAKIYQTQMIMAADKATFDTLYQECISLMKESRLDWLCEFTCTLSKEYIAEMESLGIQFQ